MCSIADYGLAIWDGKSKGALLNWGMIFIY
jgi:hypothetical protein